MSLKEIDLKELQLNPMTTISDEWWLITAGNKQNGYNTMTACWGHLGAVWGSGYGTPTAIVYIRPQRYTKQFVDREEIFTLSVMGEEYRKQMAYLGTHSGKDEDKIAKSGLTPVFANSNTYFAEAKYVFVCRKIYKAPLVEEGFIDKDIMEKNYPQRDFHDVYIGEIIAAYVAE